MSGTNKPEWASVLLFWSMYTFSWIAIKHFWLWLWLWTNAYPVQWCMHVAPLQWHHNGRDSVSNHQPHDCLLNRLFSRRSKKTSKLRVTGLCEVNSPGTGEFPAQMASYEEDFSIWWRHHDSEEMNWIPWKIFPHYSYFVWRRWCLFDDSVGELQFVSKQIKIRQFWCQYLTAVTSLKTPINHTA